MWRSRLNAESRKFKLTVRKWFSLALWVPPLYSSPDKERKKNSSVNICSGSNRAWLSFYRLLTDDWAPEYNIHLLRSQPDGRCTSPSV